MYRLIWAELKKIFLNIKFVIAIVSTIMIGIMLFTFIYWVMLDNSSYYPSGGISVPPNNTGGMSGAEYVQQVLTDFDNALNDLDTKVTALEELKDSDAKEYVTAQYEKLRDEGKKITQKYDASVLEDYDQEDLYNTQFFGEDNKLLPEFAEMLDGESSKSLYLAQLDEYIEQIKTDLNNLFSMEDSFILYPDDIEIYFLRSDLQRYLGYYYGGHYGEIYDAKDIMLMQTSYQYLVSLYSNYLILLENSPDEAEWQKDSIKWTLINLITNFQNLSDAAEEGSVFPDNSIENVLSALDDAIGIKLSTKDFDAIYDFVNTRKISVKSRLEEIYDRVDGYKSIPILSKTKIDEIFKESERYHNLLDATEAYIDCYVIYNAVKGQGANFEKFSNKIQTTEYQLKTVLTAIPYILDNGLYVEGMYLNIIKVEGYALPTGSLSFIGLMGVVPNENLNSIYNYISYVFSVLSVILITTCVIIGGGQIAGEQQSGTIKMLIIRPYKRWKILTAKLLSTLIIAVMLIIISLLLLFALGGILGFEFSSMPIFAVFNASTVVILHPFAELMIKTLFMFFMLVIYILISTMFSTVMKSRTAAVIVALLLNIVGSILLLIFGWWKPMMFLIFANTDLFVYFGQGGINGNMTFQFSFIVCLVYAAVFTVIAYWVFLKRDLN